MFICLKDGRYQYAGWLYAMLVMLYDEIEEARTFPMHHKALID